MGDRARKSAARKAAREQQQGQQLLQQQPQLVGRGAFVAPVSATTIGTRLVIPHPTMEAWGLSGTAGAPTDCILVLPDGSEVPSRVTSSELRADGAICAGWKTVVARLGLQVDDSLHISAAPPPQALRVHVSVRHRAQHAAATPSQPQPPVSSAAAAAPSVGSTPAGAAATVAPAPIIAGSVSCWILRANGETYKDEVTVPREVKEPWKLLQTQPLTLVAPTGVQVAGSVRVTARGDAKVATGFRTIMDEMPQVQTTRPSFRGYLIDGMRDTALLCVLPHDTATRVL